MGRRKPKPAPGRLVGAASRLFDAVQRTLTIGAAGVSVALPAAKAGANPFLLSAFGLIVLLLQGHAAYAAFKDWSRDKTIEEISRTVNESVRERSVVVQKLVDYLQQHEGKRLDLSGIPADLQGDPGIILYSVLAAEMRDHRRHTSAVEALLQDNQSLLVSTGVYLQQEFEAISGAAELTREDMVILGGEMRSAANQLDRLLEETRHFPPLHIPLAIYEPASSDQNKFLYSVQRVPLFGRRNEFRELRRFLDDQRDFSWWLWTGPGGVGKSRLMLELCLDAQAQGWSAGFLSRHRDFEDWDRWQPDRPTLVVVDYLAERASAVGLAIAELAERGELPNRVRFILAERSFDPEDPWARDFWNRSSATVVESIRRSCYGEPHRLEGLGAEALLSVVRFILAERGRPEPDSSRCLEALAKIDPAGRPLFAAMAAEAIGQEGLEAISRWSASDLVSHVLEREVARWRRAGVDEKHVNHLFLSTVVSEGPRLRMSDGDPQSQVAYLNQTFGVFMMLQLAWEFRDAPIPGNDERRPEHFRTMCGYTAGEDTDAYSSLEPDILGECFVLERLLGRARVSSPSQSSTQEQARRLLSMVWDHMPGRAARFVYRTALDFPDHEGLGLLFTLPAGEPPHHSSESDLMWARLASEFVDRLCGMGNLTGASGLLEDLRTVTDRNPNDEQLAALLAMGHMHRAAALAEMDAIDEAFRDYTAVVELAGAPDLMRSCALAQRGCMHLRMDRFQEAMTDFNAGLALAGEEPMAVLWCKGCRGMAYYEQHDFARARADLSDIAEAEDADPEAKAHAHHHLGLITKEENDREAALAHLRAALDLYREIGDQDVAEEIDQEMRGIGDGDT